MAGRYCGAALLGLMVTMGAMPALADDPAYLTMGAGSWETLRDSRRSGPMARPQPDTGATLPERIDEAP